MYFADYEVENGERVWYVFYQPLNINQRAFIKAGPYKTMPEADAEARRLNCVPQLEK